MADYHIQRLMNPEEELVRNLFEKAGMRFETLNKAFFTDGNDILLVAFESEEKKEALGFLYAYVLKQMQSLESLLFLYSIDVFKPHQNRGIGTEMIETLKTIGVEKDCSEIFVITNDDNGQAKSLYKKTGGVRENGDDAIFLYDLKLQKEDLPRDKEEDREDQFNG